MTIRFSKMHGAANDYVYVDGAAERVGLSGVDLASLSRAISHRHRGVGSDGLILVLPPDRGTNAHVRMRMFNADGSESEMCGNGVRCVAKFAHDRGLSKSNPIRVQTGRGVLSIDLELGSDGLVHAATVDMGEPILKPASIPVNLKRVDRVVDHATEGLIDWTIDDRDDWTGRAELDRRMTCVSMGNPHVVFFATDVALIPLDRIGPKVERAPVFPRRVNAHFVRVQSRGEVTMRTWERGSGITQACGTGACAVCVAGAISGRTDRAILAHLPGGDLRLRWDDATNHVYMTGEAVHIFDGVWPG
jgi:diaminopimelate epimerase